MNTKSHNQKTSTLNHQPSTRSKGLLIRPVIEQHSAAPASSTSTTAAVAPQAPTPAAEQSKPAHVRPYVNFQERDKNRALSTERVLEILRRWMPKQFAQAEVVGQWVWITFDEQPVEQVRAELSQLGFHWNNNRKCWQHPCGQFRTEPSPDDPRQRYGSVMASVAHATA